jgi:hypothetical protein
MISRIRKQAALHQRPDCGVAWGLVLCGAVTAPAAAHPCVAAGRVNDPFETSSGVMINTAGDSKRSLQADRRLAAGNLNNEIRRSYRVEQRRSRAHTVRMTRRSARPPANFDGPPARCFCFAAGLRKMTGLRGFCSDTAGQIQTIFKRQFRRKPILRMALSLQTRAGEVAIGDQSRHLVNRLAVTVSNDGAGKHLQASTLECESPIACVGNPKALTG